MACPAVGLAQRDYLRPKAATNTPATAEVSTLRAYIQKQREGEEG